MAELQGILDAIVDLNTQQAASSAALATQLTVIADEIAQLSAETISQADLDDIEARIRAAAQTETAQTTQIEANSAQIAGMVPDAPPTP